MACFYFDDIIKVDRLDADGKKYDKGISTTLDHLILIPINVSC